MESIRSKHVAVDVMYSLQLRTIPQSRSNLFEVHLSKIRRHKNEISNAHLHLVDTLQTYH